MGDWKSEHGYFHNSNTAVSTNGGQKRKREDEEDCSMTSLDKPWVHSPYPCPTVKAIPKSTKRQAQEGYSWWTCLQLGISVENSKPQPSQCNNNGTQ